MLDLGAYDGITGSNSLRAELAGWTVLCVEANPEMTWYLQENRALSWAGAVGKEPGPADFHLYSTTPGGFSALHPIKDNPNFHPDPNGTWTTVRVNVDTIDGLLARFGFPQLDALTIDVEGGELDALQAFDIDRWKPKVLVVESWNEDNPIVTYLEARGYRRVERRLVNDLFVRRPDAA